MDDELKASLIDHTFLKPTGAEDAVDRLCREAAACGFATVCVNPAEVARAARLLKGSGVGVCTVIGFPLGQNTARVKSYEGVEAIENGATELDLVLNRRLLKYDVTACEAELCGFAGACRARLPCVTLKLILECCDLTDDEKRLACALAEKAGFDFVKTSTGFGAGGATVEDVRLLRASVAPNVGVKAAGGIRDRETALAMVRAGATRLGTSAGCSVVKPVDACSR